MTANESALVNAERSPDATRTRTVTWQDPLSVAAAGAEMAGIDYMRALATSELPPAPMAVLMNMQPIEIEPGRAVFDGEPGEEHYNPIGVVHGGYSATIIDSVLGCAVHTTLEPGVGYTTLSLEVKMVRPVTGEIEKVRAVGEVLYRGRRQATAQAQLTDAANGKLLAHGMATCLIL